jgi:hypothetical protein
MAVGTAVIRTESQSICNLRKEEIAAVALANHTPTFATKFFIAY